MNGVSASKIKKSLNGVIQGFEKNRNTAEYSNHFTANNFLISYVSVIEKQIGLRNNTK